MKKNSHKFRTLTFLLTTIFFLNLTSCGKKDSSDDSNDDNNNTTTTASNMTAKVDGDSWSAYYGVYGGSSPAGYAYVTDNGNGTYQISILGFRYSYTNSTFSGWDEISVSVYNVSGEGTYDLSASSSVYGQGIYFSAPTTSFVDYVAFSTDTVNTGTLVITSFDYTNKKISGTFSFDAKEYAPVDSNYVVSLTEGKFTDLTWN